jgi:hypothetical protein
MRSTAAEAANRASGDFLATARKSEIDGLVSASGMTKAQIEAEQFRISQQIFALEQQRKIAQEAILAIEERIYNITELREARLLEIRNIEQVIDGLKNNQLRSAQAILDGLQKELDKNQEILDAKLLGIEKEKLAWESVQIQLDSYNQKLKESESTLQSMLDLINAIKEAMAGIDSFSGSNLTGSSIGSGGNAYVAPVSTAADIAAFNEFIVKNSAAVNGKSIYIDRGDQSLDATYASYFPAFESALNSYAKKNKVSIKLISKSGHSERDWAARIGPILKTIIK